MKSTVLALVIVAVASTVSLSQTQSQCKELEAHVATLRSFHPRSEGSEGDARAQSFVLDQLRELDIEAQRVPIGSQVSGHSFSASVTGRIEGALADTVVFAAPLNHADGAAPAADGSAAIAVLLNLARLYAGTTPPVTLEFAFLGADHDERSIGSRSFVERLDLRNPTTVVYLGQRNDQASFALRTSATDMAAPRSLVEDITTALSRNNIPFRISLARAQAARSGQVDERTPIAEYLEEGIPAIALADPAGEAGNTRNAVATAGRDAASPCSVPAALAAFIETYQEGLPDTWDRHYLFFQRGTEVLFIGETAYLSVLIFVILAALLYGLLFRGRLSRYVETLGRNFFNLPIVFLVIFGSLAISGAVFNRIPALRDFPQLWEYYPLVFFLGKMLLAAAVYDVLHRVFLSGTLSQNGSYYSASALAALFVGIIVLAFIDVSTTPYFLWAFICAFLFSVLRFRLLKVLSFLASTLLLLQFAVEIFRAPLTQVAESIVRAGSVENLLIAVVLLPFVLMLVRVDFLFRRGPLTGTGPVSIGLLVLLSLGGLSAAGFAVFAWPFDETRPQPVTATETIDHRADTHTLVFESPASLGSFELEFGEELLTVETEARRFALELEDMPELVELSQGSRQFLNRSRREVMVDAAFPLDRILVGLRGETSIPILDANFPISGSHVPPDGAAEDRSTRYEELRFQIGPSPPLPLVVDYTIPIDSQARVFFEGRARRLSRPFEPARGAVAITPELIIRRTLEEP